MHVGDQHALWLQKCNDNSKRARRIPHSIIRPISPLPNQGIEAMLLHSSQTRITSFNQASTPSTPNRSKTITSPARASFPSSSPQVPPPLLPHLLHLSSSYSITLFLFFTPATLPRCNSPFASLQSNPVTLPPVLLPTLSQSPQSPKEPSAKSQARLTIGLLSRAPPAQVLFCLTLRVE
ncbi:uncharacterized protein TrAtP1_000810 [Trichoderma atroviride]|uniref:uncharacterized protein n=1 Tax=Hypocrea atroviridis TaxID=63577 RepID=UPI00331D43DD|nr:hypothetical protein TrAtP1_000810 [Trichoderma atroviride]